MSAKKELFRVVKTITRAGHAFFPGHEFEASPTGKHVLRWLALGKIERATVKVAEPAAPIAAKIEIEAMQKELLAMITHLGCMAQNLEEASDWTGDEKHEEAALSLEAVSSGAEDALHSLRRIALKCDEICSRKAVGA